MKKLWSFGKRLLFKVILASIKPYIFLMPYSKLCIYNTIIKNMYGPTPAKITLKRSLLPKDHNFFFTISIGVSVYLSICCHLHKLSITDLKCYTFWKYLGSCHHLGKTNAFDYFRQIQGTNNQINISQHT